MPIKYSTAQQPYSLLIVTDIVFIACTFANNTLQLLVDTSDSSNTEKPRDFVKDWGMPDKATVDTARRACNYSKKQYLLSLCLHLKMAL
jgi:hypothetical protein